MKQVEDFQNVRNIYYRGSLDTCNYHCPYCPFGKKEKRNNPALDEEHFIRFCDQMIEWPYSVRIFIIPYGEAMIHPYYRANIIRLAQQPHIEGIGIQTNLSFPVLSFIQKLRKARIELPKIKLWASYHPGMITLEAFNKKVFFLKQAGIQITAGVVGEPNNYDRILRLRELLEPDTYLFINKIEGRNIAVPNRVDYNFQQIDPLYMQDCKNAKANYEVCKGGKENIFVDEKGDMYPCPRSMQVIGNLYEGKITPGTECVRSHCDCYLAYSNLSDHPVNHYLGEGAFWRIPEKKKIKAAFFDIDGTLTDDKGMVPDSYKTALTYMSKKIPLFIATALPYSFAQKRLGDLLSLFKGGIFADGGHIQYESENLYTPMKKVPLGLMDKTGYFIREHESEDEVYKYSILASTRTKAEQLKEILQQPGYNVFHEDKLITITDKEATKPNGIQTICKKENISPDEVLAIGNTIYDLPMLEIAGYPCAVLEAEEGLKEKASYILNPDHIPIFFED